MSAYDELIGFTRETVALGQVMGRLGWDQETVMPEGAAPQRAEEMAALEKVLHGRRTDPRVGDWLAKAEAPDAAGAAQLREIRRSYERAVKVPEALAAAIAGATSRAQRVWAKARKENDFSAFAPVLAEVLRLRCEEADAVRGDKSRYDAMLDDYEPGESGETLAAMFAVIRPRLAALREAVLESGKVLPELDFSFDEAGQMALSQKLAAAFGYDFDKGRIDKAVHPFSSGSGLDVRITTRTEARDPFNCFYSTIHEVGHASYEQTVDPAYLLTPIGQGASMGVHESQSRIYENQFGRSLSFCQYLFTQMRETFGDFGIESAENLYRAANRVHRGFIRTESDEVQYNLHILMRFDLERAMVSGDLAPGDLPGAWNDRFEADFGVKVPDMARGCLQDVHWSVGLFGYFPTYTLGNLYAGCLFKALRADLPGLDAALATGDTAPARDWLAERLQRHGALRMPRETIEHAIGGPVSAEPLLTYLEEKFGALYGL